MNKPIRLVLLEDVATDAELIERSLRRDGLDVSITHVAARKAYEDALSREAPDVILSDYNLPDISGLEAFELARETSPGVPFIIVTASIDEETAVRCMKLGVADYVLKEQLVRLGPSLRSALELRDRVVAQRESEAAVRERDALLQSVLRSLPDRIAVLAWDGRILTVNDAWREFAAAQRNAGLTETGIGEDYVAALEKAVSIGRAAYPSDAGSKLRAVLEKRQTTFEIEYESRNASGERQWFVMTVSALDSPDGGAIVSHHEITQIRAAEERYRRFFEEDFAADFLCCPEGKVIDCNSSFVNMFETETVERARGRGLSEYLMLPDDWNDLLEALGKKKRLEHHRLSMRTLQGRELSVVGNVIGTYDENQRLTEIRGYLIDETALRELEGQFLQAQKMEAIGQLAGGIAHDFNNLLSAILGYSDFAASTLGEEHPVADDLQMIHKAGERAAALTRQLLAFSRRQILQPVVLDVNHTVLELEKLMRRLIGEDIDLVTKLAPDVGKVKADPGQIEQVIVNLAVNARDAMPGGGKLTIETANVDLGAAYARENLNVRPGPYVSVAMSDNGCGMDEKISARIFEPFFTTKPEGKGTGLGLSTVYGIIKQSGGNVTVYSEPEKGTTFKIYLPRIDDAAERSTETAPQKVPISGDETILVVEDDDGVRLLTKRILKEQGYTVLESRTGDGALRVSECYPDPVHLLLTNVVVPGLSGPEIADAIRRQRPDIRVIFMSGYTGTAALFQGPVGRKAVFVQKPFTPLTLCTQVRRTLNATAADARDEPDETDPQG